MIYTWFVGNFEGTIPWNIPHRCIICLMVVCLILWKWNTCLLGLGAWEEGRVGAGGYWSMKVSCTSTTHNSEVRNLCFKYIDASLACDDLPAHKKISPCLWAKHTIQKGSLQKKTEMIQFDQVFQILPSRHGFDSEKLAVVKLDFLSSKGKCGYQLICTIQPLYSRYMVVQI